MVMNNVQFHLAAAEIYYIPAKVDVCQPHFSPSSLKGDERRRGRREIGTFIFNDPEFLTPELQSNTETP